MANLVHMPGSSKNLGISSERLVKSCISASSPTSTSKKAFNNIKYLGKEAASGKMVLFLLKLAALDIVRRLSRRRCPFVWHAIQSLQLLSFPPLRWIQRWGGPLKGLVKGMQAFSRPFLVLSVATAFSEESKSSKKVSNDASDPRPSEPPATLTTSALRSCDQSSESKEPDDSLIQLRMELEKQGLFLPERINDDELRGFYTAVGTSFPSLLQSLKKTIQWRQSYRFLSPEELEAWSHLMFWHCTDVKLRPCLIIRLGLACCRLVPRDRPNFAHAIVSQIEYGALNLVNRDDPRVTVLMDCEGLSPFRFPMKMLTSCATLMQDHYPDRLATLLVIRLPPVVRVLAQTVIQVLKPQTRRKLRIEGDAYKKFLSEFLLDVPSFLGGKCKCSRCYVPPSRNNQDCTDVNTSKNEPDEKSDQELDDFPSQTNDFTSSGNYEEILKNAMISFLMLWIVLIVLMGMHDSGSFLR